MATGITTSDMAKNSILIGAGAGFTGDRIDPAVELSEQPDLDYLAFECMAELTVARSSAADGPTYDPWLGQRMRAVLENCVENDITIVTNMGGLDPREASNRVVEIAQEQGLLDLTVASVGGSDVTEMYDRLQPVGDEAELSRSKEDVLAATVYLGTDAIVESLETGADVVVTGRVTDSALFLAPMIYEFGWETDPMTATDRIGQGLVVGNLLECAGQVTGGYYADPGYKDVEELGRLGFPIAEVTSDGGATITKPEGSGGEVTARTCTEQLLYEVHDPSEYITPDGVADFTGVEFHEQGDDVVEVTGAVAKPRPDTLKVTVAYEGPFVGEGSISYAGPGALDRAKLAGEILEERLERSEREPIDLRIDLIGIDALHGKLGEERTEVPPYEVRTRIAATFESRQGASLIAHEVLALLTNGPAGGGGQRTNIERQTNVESALIDRMAVTPEIETVGVTATEVQL